MSADNHKSEVGRKGWQLLAAHGIVSTVTLRFTQIPGVWSSGSLGWVQTRLGLGR